MTIREIKKEAKERFALNRYQAMLVYGVVYTLALNIAVLTTVLFLVNRWAVWYGILLVFVFLLMLAPFHYGMTGFYVKLYRYEDINAFHIFDGFNRYNLERVIILRLLKFALGLAFTLLLIVPGIVFAVRTQLSTYILCFDQKCKPFDALKRSNRYMKGHCAQYVGLVLSFAGWFFMGLLTCGLGFIWLAPYFHTAKIVFFRRAVQGDTAVYKHGAARTPASPEAQDAPESEEDAEYARLLAELNDVNAQLSAQTKPPVAKAAPKPVPPVVEKEIPVEAKEMHAPADEEIFVETQEIPATADEITATAEEELFDSQDQAFFVAADEEMLDGADDAFFVAADEDFDNSGEEARFDFPDEEDLAEVEADFSTEPIAKEEPTQPTTARQAQEARRESTPRRRGETSSRSRPSAVPRRSAERPPISGTRLQVDADGRSRTVPPARPSRTDMTPQERLEKLRAERDALRHKKD